MTKFSLIISYFSLFSFVVLSLDGLIIVVISVLLSTLMLNIFFFNINCCEETFWFSFSMTYFKETIFFSFRINCCEETFCFSFNMNCLKETITQWFFLENLLQI